MAVTFIGSIEIHDEVQRQLADANAAWLGSDNAYKSVIARHIVIPETTFYFYRQTSGFYKCETLGESGAILFKTSPASGNPWTPASATANFIVDCRGTIQLTSGTDGESDPIAILGALVDIGPLMFELLHTKATRTVVTNQGSVGVGDTFVGINRDALPEERIRKQAEWWRGFC